MLGLDPNVPAERTGIRRQLGYQPQKLPASRAASPRSRSWTTSRCSRSSPAGRERLLADRHRPVPQRRRPCPGRRRARRTIPRRRLPATARRVTGDTNPPRTWRHDHDTRARPARSRRRRITFAALAARRCAGSLLNPLFLAAIGLTAYLLWSGQRSTVTEIDSVNAIAATLFGGLGMMAAFWLTRSMRASEQVVGVTPVTLPRRTAALCTVAIVSFLCGCLALLWFVRLYPVSEPVYGAFSQPARIAVLVGQIVVPSLGGPLLGVALGRWVRFPGAPFVLFLLLSGWINLVNWLSITYPDSAPVAVLRLLAPFALFTCTATPASRPGAGRHGSSSAGSSPCARSRSWWRCCAGPRGGCAPGSSVPSASCWRWP